MTGSAGVSAFVSCLTISSLARSNVPVNLVSIEEAPILTVYFPASAIHDEVGVSKEASFLLSRMKVRVWLSPGVTI